MEYLQKTLEILNQVPAEAWSTLIEIIVAAVVVSPVALGIKKWLDVEKEKVMLGVVILGSLLSSAVVYLRDTPEFGPWFVLVQGWLIFATTQPVYYLFIKPLYTKIAAWFTLQLAEAVKIKSAQEELKSALEPVGGLRITPDPAPVAAAPAVTPTRVEIHDFN